MNPKGVTRQLLQFPSRFLRASHQFGRMVRRDVVGMTPEQIRTTLDAVARLYPGHFNVAFERVEVAGVPCGHFYPRHAKATSVRMVLAHGGGFAFGSALTHRAFASALVHALQCQVWIPDYRLAPEHPFPTPLEDVMAVTAALAASGDNVWLMGDSAGGNLALSTALELTRKSPNAITGVGLFSPWLDLRPQSESNQLAHTATSPFERLDMVEYAAHYLHGQSAEHPLADPLSGDLKSLQHVYIEASEAEYLYPDALRAHREMTAAGVQMAWRKEKRALHGWQLFPDVLPEARRSISAFCEFVESVEATL